MPEAFMINSGNPALSPTITTADDATVIRLCDEILAGFAESSRLAGDDGRSSRANWAAIRTIVADGHAARAQMAAIPARTLAGRRAKAAVLAHLFGEDYALALSLADDLLAASA
jgi:hypothetical protein